MVACGLPSEQGYDGAPRLEDIAISHANEARALECNALTGHHSLSQRFAHSIDIDGRTSLVSRHHQHDVKLREAVHMSPDRINDILDAEHIGLHALKRDHFAAIDLFQSRCDDDDRRLKSKQRLLNPCAVPDIADSIDDVAIWPDLITDGPVLCLVAGEQHERIRARQTRHQGSPQRTSSTEYENALVYEFISKHERSPVRLAAIPLIEHPIPGGERSQLTALADPCLQFGQKCPKEHARARWRAGTSLARLRCQAHIRSTAKLRGRSPRCQISHMPA